MVFPATGSVPRTLTAPRFRLEPLGPEHNDSDHRAWSASIDHIRATPGFAADEWNGDAWPYPMSAEDNRADLVDHAREFGAGDAYAFTVLDPATGEVIGCCYVDPDRSGEVDAVARLWVTADRADLDPELTAAVRRWLADHWPPMTVRFPGRDDAAVR